MKFSNGQCLSAVLAIFVSSLLWPCAATADVTFLQSAGTASAAASIKPNRPDPDVIPPGTEGCDQRGITIAPDSLTASDTKSCVRGNAFGSARGESAFMLNVTKTGDQVSEILLSGSASASSTPSAEFTGAVTRGTGNIEASVAVQIDEKVTVRVESTASGSGLSGSGSLRVQSPSGCSGGACTLNLLNCNSSSSDGCDLDGTPEINEIPAVFDLEPGVYQFVVRAGALGLTIDPLFSARESSGSITARISFDIARDCDLTWNSFAPGTLGSGENAFDDEDNWSPEQSPEDDGTGCNNLLIDRAGNFTVRMSKNEAANRLTLRTGNMELQAGPNAVLQLAGRGVATDPGLLVGEGANLTVRAAGIDSNGAEVGGFGGGDGLSRLEVTGPTSRLRSRDGAGQDRAIRVGTLQNAELVIANGGTVSAGVVDVGLSRVADTVISGKLIVTGRNSAQSSTLTSSEEIVIGESGTGELTVEAGGLLQTTDFAGLRFGNLGNGELQVTGVHTASGTPSRAEISGVLNVAGNGATRPGVFIGDGATLTADGVRIGENGAGAMFIESGARVDVADSLRLNPGKDALLEMASGGKLTLGGAFNVGLGSGTRATAIARGDSGGATTQLTGVLFQVGGEFGTGLFEITGNSNVEGTDLFVPKVDVANNPGNGTVRVEDGAIVSFSRLIDIGAQGPGLIVVAGPSVLSADEKIEVSRRGKLEVGRLGTVRSPRVRVVERGGTIRGTRQQGKQGGDAPGTVDGDLELAEGAILSLKTDRNGGVALAITGNLIADGTLELVLPDDIPLAADVLLDVLDVGGVTTGNFTEITAPSRTADFAATTVIENGELMVRIVTPGAPLNAGEGEGEGITEGEGEGEGSPEGEGEGEDPPVEMPSCGCNGDNNKNIPWGDILSGVLGIGVMVILHARRISGR